MLCVPWVWLFSYEEMLDYKKLKYPNKKVGGIGNDTNDNNSYN